MATGTKTTYWNDRELPSVLKHNLLGRYIPQFGGMTGSRDGRVVYLDGYAGEGRYESGEAGSAEIAMRVASKHLKQHGLRWTCFFTERELKSFTKLEKIAGIYRAQGVDARVHHGDVDGVLNEVLVTATNLPLFLFLDPCGLGLPWDRLTEAMALRRSPKLWPPTEFLMNFSMVAVRRLGGNARSAKGVERSSERFDEVCGGRWWRDFFPTGKEPALDADEAVAAEYARRLEAATGMLVRSVPVAKAPHLKPVYHLVYGTWRQHGLWVFGDSAARARDEWWKKLEFAEEENEPDALFSATSVTRPDPKVVLAAAVPAMAQNIEGLLRRGRAFKLVDHTLDVFGDYYGQVTEGAARAAVKLLHEQGRTPSTGISKNKEKTRDLIVEPQR
ncbi:three-Cys-motif partner protein [Streptomyces sp. DvalAA-14]|uniref:three-Cys-motif partner protein TcmP n=2 Tax=unclassified Streptomyces TaxID=2593676 RepID=UPI00081BBEF7|nr:MULTISPECIES: three-Cys-motif partner protein TcmP [unclassified Streptomyces]MYS19879.1 three-Cys-motif partner protein TcmP [Streptomyces sp. SID4948]SCD55568.1 three-Cys-motif partner protein [Streptomyces sp. DvalAA-14]